MGKKLNVFLLFVTAFCILILHLDVETSEEEEERQQQNGTYALFRTIHTKNPPSSPTTSDWPRNHSRHGSVCTIEVDGGHHPKPRDEHRWTNFPDNGGGNRTKMATTAVGHPVRDLEWLVGIFCRVVWWIDTIQRIEPFPSHRSMEFSGNGTEEIVSVACERISGLCRFSLNLTRKANSILRMQHISSNIGQSFDLERFDSGLVRGSARPSRVEVIVAVDAISLEISMPMACSQ